MFEYVKVNAKECSTNDIDNYINMATYEDISNKLFYFQECSSKVIKSVSNVSKRTGVEYNLHFDIIFNIVLKDGSKNDNAYDIGYFMLYDNNSFLESIESCDVIIVNSFLRRNLLALDRNKINYNLDYFCNKLMINKEELM